MTVVNWSLTLPKSDMEKRLKKINSVGAKSDNQKEREKKTAKILENMKRGEKNKKKIFKSLQKKNTRKTLKEKKSDVITLYSQTRG